MLTFENLNMSTLEGGVILDSCQFAIATFWYNVLSYSRTLKLFVFCFNILLENYPFVKMYCISCILCILPHVQG